MKTAKLVILLALWAAAAAAEVVVLRGGTRIDVKQPPTRQGSTVLLTRRDGTLLSVPVSEIDQQATSAANAAAAAAPPVAPAAKASAETPASAARAAREGPKARVKLTDADVGHYLEVPGGGSGEEKKEGGGGTGSGASVDISTYTQSKTGDNLIVKGSLRNLGTTAALNTRLTVTPIDDKGQPIDSAEASVSSGTIEPGREANFSATIPVGNRVVQTMRFSPRWVSQATPAETAAAAAAAQASALPGSGTGSSAAAAPAGAASKAPRPVPTPYGLGLNYAPPPPNAPMAPPPDGKTGYIPGAATPENQPKPPE
ncbi:MAG TPA: hypothetical protein VMR54_03980 [Thermoanaerobaculia bacterium]|nr:hypothetical protein [Thermoanaerobaculia bacterium]